jgi:NAD-dependent SIR2 family protein deacetylase
MLDVLAGVSEDKMIECHGHFRTASCTKCSRAFEGKECKQIIVEEKKAPKCSNCGGYVKPDIVFFGESLPTRFHKLVKQDTKNADLLIVMGTCECNANKRCYFWPLFAHDVLATSISKPSWLARSI